MATIAIYSSKGGVGKTTFAANLAWCSATQSERSTLLWDLDHSGGASFMLGHEPEARSRLDLLFERGADARRKVHNTDWDNLDLLPADSSLRGLDRKLARLSSRKRIADIARKLSRNYDRIILDCPPVLNEISDSALRAADLVIVPMPPSPLSKRAFDTVVEQVKACSKPHPPILPVLSMMDMRRKLHREAREANPEWPAIPFASAAEQAAVRQAPVGSFAKSSPTAKAFTKLWAAIERKLIWR